jgi:hypothetical protein
MKTWLLALVLLIPSLSFSQFQSDLIVTSPNGVWTDARAYSTLNAAITALGTDQRTIVIASPQTITSLTIPSTVTLRFERDGAINNSGTLTIQTKNITAEDRQIFTGAGSIVFASGTIVHSAWFSDINTALTKTSSDSVTLLISKEEELTADRTLGTNVSLKWASPNNRLTINAGVTLSNVSQIEAGDYQILVGDGDVDFVSGTSLNVNWFNSLRVLLTWIEDEEVSITIANSTLVDYPITIPRNVILDCFSRAGTLSISPGVTLTIYSPYSIAATPIQQPLRGGGLVSFTTPGLVYVDWFGAESNDLVDDVTAIQNAIDSMPYSGTIKLNEGLYLISSGISLVDKYGLVFTGSSRQAFQSGATHLTNGSVLKRTGSPISTIIDMTSTQFVEVSNLGIDGMSIADGKAVLIYSDNDPVSRRDRLLNISIANIGTSPGTGTGIGVQVGGDLGSVHNNQCDSVVMEGLDIWSTNKAIFINSSNAMQMGVIRDGHISNFNRAIDIERGGYFEISGMIISIYAGIDPYGIRFNYGGNIAVKNTIIENNEVEGATYGNGIFFSSGNYSYPVYLEKVSTSNIKVGATTNVFSNTCSFSVIGDFSAFEFTGTDIKWISFNDSIQDWNNAGALITWDDALSYNPGTNSTVIEYSENGIKYHGYQTPIDFSTTFSSLPTFKLDGTSILTFGAQTFEWKPPSTAPIFKVTSSGGLSGGMMAFPTTPPIFYMGTFTNHDEYIIRNSSQKTGFLGTNGDLYNVGGGYIKPGQNCTFATLATCMDINSSKKCTDCTPNAVAPYTCAGSGSGAWVFDNNGTKKCPF